MQTLLVQVAAAAVSVSGVSRPSDPHGRRRPPGSPRTGHLFIAAETSIRVEIAEGLSSDARHALLRQSVDGAFDLRTACLPGMRFEPLERSPLGVLTAEERILFGHSAGGSWNALVRDSLAAARVAVTEAIAPAVPKLLYFVPIVAGGAASMITGRSLFEPLPAGLSWTALTPHRYLEYGVMWDPRRSTDLLERFISYTRRHATQVPGEPAAAGATASSPVPTGPADDPGDVASRPDFDLRLVRPFVTVAEEMHFGRAAERLVTAQPALSRQVARLESQLGAQLLVRSTRTVELTRAGQLTLAAGRDILDHANRAQLSASRDTTATVADGGADIDVWPGLGVPVDLR